MKKFSLFLFLFTFISFLPLNVKASDYTCDSYVDRLSSVSDSNLLKIKNYILDLYNGKIKDSSGNNYIFNSVFSLGSIGGYFTFSIANINNVSFGSYPMFYPSFNPYYSFYINNSGNIYPTSNFGGGELYLSGECYIDTLFWSDGSSFLISNDSISLSDADFTKISSYLPFGSKKLLSSSDSYFYRKYGSYIYPYVEDTIPPVINILGGHSITHEINTSWNDPGYSCIDDTDNTCTVNYTSNLDISKIGDYEITYTAIDSANNQSSIVRFVSVVDTIPPKITLFGDNLIYYSLNDIYIELGASIIDNSNENIDLIIDSSNIDLSKQGNYLVYYSASDSSGNISVIERSIIVRSVKPIDFSGSQYLPFNFADIQEIFPNINFSDFSVYNQFLVVILFNIFFFIFIFIMIYIILKCLYKIKSICF